MNHSLVESRDVPILLRRRLASTLSAVLACAIVAGSLRAEDATNWPQFRGADSRGVSTSDALPHEWDREKNVRWVIDVPGRGWSSPIVWGERVFLTTAVADSPPEEARKGLYFGGERPRRDVEHQWLVMCLDAGTGRLRWIEKVHEAVPAAGIHIKSTYASETPVTDGERVYAYFGNVGLFALDMDGDPAWERRWPAVKTRHGWGTASSPTLHRGRIYIVNDNDTQSYVVALDAKTGRDIWHIERDEKSNWSTPFVWEAGGRTEIVTPGTGKVRSYGVDGSVLWELAGMSSITIMTPFAAHGLLYISSGYVGDQNRPVYAIRPGAEGDISLEEGERSNASIAWCERKAAPYNPSPIVYGDYLYVLYDRGFFFCHNAKTGELVYKKRLAGDIGGFGGFTCSPWAYGGRVFCLNEDGETFVVKAGPEYELLGVNRLEEMAMATPAIAGGRLFVRTLTKLYCIESGGETGADGDAGQDSEDR